MTLPADLEAFCARHTIIAKHERPPIPTNAWDWVAYDDDTYDGEGSHIGYGPTREAALRDLMNWMEEE